jgi:uncharacterized protein YndB with AHSA1/START domain
MNDQREIRLEVEVPGTPEEVWDAIATGPGITSWFVPAQLDGERLGLRFGPGDVYEHRVTAADPPHRFVYEAEQGGHALAFEWLVEARSGGTCVVRLVNSGFEPGSGWEDDFDGMSAGWPLFLTNLRLYLTHFRGQPCSSAIVNGRHPEAREPAWRDAAGALGLDGAGEGDRVATPGPVIAGTVERRFPTMITLRIDDPHPGIAFVASEGGGEHAFLSVYLYLFGDGAPEAAAAQQAAWQAWMDNGFRLPGGRAPSSPLAFGDVTLRKS